MQGACFSPGPGLAGEEPRAPGTCALGPGLTDPVCLRPGPERSRDGGLLRNMILVIVWTFPNSQRWGNGLNHGKVIECVQFFLYVSMLAGTTEEYFSSEVLVKNSSEHHKIHWVQKRRPSFRESSLRNQKRHRKEHPADKGTLGPAFRLLDARPGRAGAWGVEQPGPGRFPLILVAVSGGVWKDRYRVFPKS